MTMNRTASLSAIFALAATAAGGQAPSSPVDTAAPICWRARPLAECRRWVITEVAMEQPMGSTGADHTFGPGGSYYSDDFGTRLTFTLGGMKNVGPTRAVGLTAALSMDDPDALVPNRVEARYRRWIDRTNGFDLSAGLARKTIRGDDELQSIVALGPTVSAGVTTTYFGIDGRVDLLRGNGRPVMATFIGVRAGSRAGPIVAVSGFLLFLGAFAAMTGPNY